VADTAVMGKAVKPKTVVKWPKCDPATVAPLNRDGDPDMRNHMPTRFVSMEEAIAREWKYFYTGESCRWGHRAPRYVSNKNNCIDCERIREGKLPIGIKGVQEYDGPQPVKPAYSQRSTSVAVVSAAPREPDAIEKFFLTKYVELKNFSDAAKAGGQSEAYFLARLSYNKTFRDAVHQLEADNGLARTPSLTEDFDWDDDKRNVLMRVYIDTGDLLTAMQGIGVSNYHFEKELRENAEFRADMEQAEELATKQHERYAISLARKGDSRLLQRMLAAVMPEKWGDRVNMNLNVTAKLTNDQLAARLEQQLAWLERRGFSLPAPSEVVEAEFVAVEPDTAPEPAGDGGGDPPPVRENKYLDLV
jgi:hypothetical protein